MSDAAAQIAENVATAVANNCTSYYAGSASWTKPLGTAAAAPLARMPCSLRQRNKRLTATPCFFATRVTGEVLLSSIIACFSASDQRRRASISYTLVICPDIGTVIAPSVTKSVTPNDHPQHLSKPRKAVLGAGIPPDKNFYCYNTNLRSIGRPCQPCCMRRTQFCPS